MIVFLVKILEALFVVGVVGCLITIPLAGWGYASVLFEKEGEIAPTAEAGEESSVFSRSEPQSKSAD